MENLLTVKEAAQYLKLNYMTVYRLAQRGRIPAIKVGRNWRFKREILDDWLAKQARITEGFVLVVDDDARVRDLLVDIVSAQGYRPVAVDNGERALEELGRQHFDLVFLDLVLPGVSGLDILRAIKERDKRAVVVIVTGYGDDPLALEAMSLGPLLLIRKPFRTSDIIEVLNIVMRTRK